MKQSTETEITSSIRGALKMLNVFCWKQWQGPMSQPKGVSDIIGILPKGIAGSDGGRFLAIEVKRPGGKVSPHQEQFIERVNRIGGLGFVAYSVEDVINRLGVRDRFLF
jgi:hypothetical protein